MYWTGLYKQNKKINSITHLLNYFNCLTWTKQCGTVKGLLHSLMTHDCECIIEHDTYGNFISPHWIPIDLWSVRSIMPDPALLTDKLNLLVHAKLAAKHNLCKYATWPCRVICMWIKGGTTGAVFQEQSVNWHDWTQMLSMESIRSGKPGKTKEEGDYINTICIM